MVRRVPEVFERDANARAGHPGGARGARREEPGGEGEGERDGVASFYEGKKQRKQEKKKPQEQVEEEDVKKRERQGVEAVDVQKLSDPVENKRGQQVVDNPGIRKATST